jgi:hypothetical protein
MENGVEVHRLGPEARVAARRGTWIPLAMCYGVLLAAAGILGDRASAREHAAFGIATILVLCFQIFNQQAAWENEARQQASPGPRR